MKQYVLDEPMGAAPLSVEPHATSSLAQPGWWRWLLLAILVEAVALAMLYVALNGVPDSSSAAPSRGVAYVASFSFPREAEPAAVQSPPAVAPVSRIHQQRGRYVVELHGESPATALAMLAEATKVTVAGSRIFAGSSLRLTRSVVAASPREAWQAVFGDVANFAIACAGSACEVRFVSLAKPGAPVPGPDVLPSEVAETEPATAPTFAPPAQAAVDQAPTERPVKNGEEN